MNYGDCTSVFAESKTESAGETKEAPSKNGQYSRNKPIEAATHFAGAVCHDLAHTAAEVTEAGMNDRRKSASAISETPPVTGLQSFASAYRNAAVIHGHARTCAASIGNAERNSFFHSRVSKAGAMANPMKKSESTEYAYPATPLPKSVPRFSHE